MSLLANSNAIESGGYNIDRSLRFRSSASAYLSRTPASNGNLKTWTWSGWVKRGAFGTYNTIFSAGNNATVLMFNKDLNEGIGLYDYDGTSLTYYLAANAVFRDPSAWYHVVAVLDTTNATASNRVRLYVNGQQITSFSTATYPTQNYQTYWNRASYAHNIGQTASLGRYHDGYLAEVNFIDGQALTPSSFGQTDAVTGVWQPKKYTGTYGTNGFYLPFSDNTSATTLAYDKSGNGNNWTPNNISTTAGATYDSMTDVPTLTSATAANFATLNPTAQGQFSNSYSSAPASATGATLTQGNLYATGANAGTGAYGAWVGTMPLDNGKWYWESTLIAEPTADFSFCGIVRYDNGTTNTPYFPSNGLYTVNDVLGFTWDDTAKELKWYKNGALQATLVTGASGSYLPWVGLANANVMAFNFGQRPFSYTPPTGFKALNTFNLPDPTIKKPSQYMTVDTFTGDATNYRQRSVGMKPDLVWVKNRAVAWDNILGDTTRLDGLNQPILLSSNLTNAEFANGYISSTNNWPPDGYAVNADARVNGSGNGIVSWLWKKGATPGFDIVTYTGTGANRTVSHSLGVAPTFMLIKSRSGTTTWIAYHGSLGPSQYLVLNATNAAATLASVWNSTAPTSSVFSLGTDGSVNTNAATYVAYLFAEIPGFSKFGRYTGNGSTDGPFVYTNFQPKYVLIKRTNSTGNWYVWDTTRNTYNVVSNELYPNLSNAEASNSDLDVNSNGFKIRNTTADFNASGGTYIYAAFSTFPFKYSTAR